MFPVSALYSPFIKQSNLKQGPDLHGGLSSVYPGNILGVVGTTVEPAPLIADALHC